MNSYKLNEKQIKVIEITESWIHIDDDLKYNYQTNNDISIDVSYSFDCRGNEISIFFDCVYGMCQEWHNKCILRISDDKRNQFNAFEGCTNQKLNLDCDIAFYLKNYQKILQFIVEWLDEYRELSKDIYNEEAYEIINEKIKKIKASQI